MTKAVTERTIVNFPTEKLHAHSSNDYLYRDHADQELIDSIKAVGIRVPILACRTGRIIVSGHRRWEAAKHLGMEEVPVEFIGKMHPEEITELLIYMNRQRARTVEQKAREAATLVDCEDKRRRRAKKLASSQGEPAPVFEKNVRQEVASKLNVGEKTVQRSVAVTKALEDAEQKGDEEKVTEIKQAASKSLRAAAEVVAPKPKPKSKPDAWDFDREGVIEELELAELAMKDSMRAVKRAVNIHGDESIHSQKLTKLANDYLVRLTQFKDSVR